MKKRMSCGSTIQTRIHLVYCTKKSLPLTGSIGPTVRVATSTQPTTVFDARPWAYCNSRLTILHQPEFIAKYQNTILPTTVCTALYSYARCSKISNNRPRNTYSDRLPTQPTPQHKRRVIVTYFSFTSMTIFSNSFRLIHSPQFTSNSMKSRSSPRLMIGHLKQYCSQRSSSIFGSRHRSV
jgi:hypothetical protein